jgi:cation transport regulator ChaC
VTSWVFGYGSLVSPTSLESTIGRRVASTDVAVAHLDGFGRRWNYGSMHLRGDWHHDGANVRQGLVVSLGLVVADAESCNGLAVRVTDAELALLDWRERDYERTDVTDRITSDGVDGDRIVTYVPRQSAVERYLSARDEGRAGIRRSYWDLVIEAFDALGPEHAEVYRRTPPPDVPVVEMSLSMLG